MALPAFREDGWLPPGHHVTTWEEVAGVFGGSPGSVRQRVWERLTLWRDRARECGLTGTLLLDGSFVSRKEAPQDFDAIFVGDMGVEGILARDDTARLLVSYPACKVVYRGDLLFFSEEALRRFPDLCRLDGFDYNKEKQPKGLVELRV